MPAKRVIILDQKPGTGWYSYVLWADVPVANQMAYRNPAAVSSYGNANPAEIQAIRDGLVTEKVGTLQIDDTAMPTVQANLQAAWTEFQNSISSQVAWQNYGSFWNGSAWQATAGVPMFNMKAVQEGCATFSALTSQSAFSANKIHFVLANAIPIAQGQSQTIKIKLIAILPGTTTVTGVAPSVFSLQRRDNVTVLPNGGNSVPIASYDSSVSIPTGVAAFNAPTTPPSGGNVIVLNRFIPQADEIKLTTADAPTMASFSTWGGQIIYKHSDLWNAQPLTIRAGETLEIVQSATAGTGNCSVLCIFSV